MDKVNDFKLAVTAVVALLTSLWGWFGWLVVLFVGCMAVDYLTGTAAAMHRGEWSSKSARDGIFHKIGSVIVVMVAGAADLLIGLQTKPGSEYAPSLSYCHSYKS